MNGEAFSAFAEKNIVNSSLASISSFLCGGTNVDWGEKLKDFLRQIFAVGGKKSAVDLNI
jgi:hypothetical protein